MAGKELQPLSVDASFNLLGCVTREASSEEKPCVGVNDWCLEASEVYEYGLSLNNSLYRSRVLLPMKLLHSMRLSEMGYVEACVAYLEELRESVRASRVTNESFIQQLELLENRVRQSEKEWVCVECVTRRQVAGKGGFLSQLFTVVDKGINSFMTAVEEKEEVVEEKKEDDNVARFAKEIEEEEPPKGAPETGETIPPVVPMLMIAGVVLGILSFKRKKEEA